MAGKMKHFEHIIVWWWKGIFPDDYYNMYDLEYAGNRIIIEYKTREE